MSELRSSPVVDRVILGDCLEVMSGLPGECVDLVFADPPYNLQLDKTLLRPNNTRVDGVEEAWDRFDDFANYDRFTIDWLTAARRLLKPSATLWVIGTYHNIFRIGAVLQDLGYWILNDIIWRKSNPMPNFRGRRFTNAHETLIWCARERDARHTFNYHAMKNLNDELQMRSDWMLPLCTGPERLRRDGRKAHPTQKPEALLHRILLASTAPGDVVLDPFFGSGTTGAAARKLGRRFIGIERDGDYVRLAERRLAGISPPTDPQLFTTPSPRNEPRIPFGWVVERGMLRPGQVLFDQQRRHTARVAADGTVVTADFRGSIHQAGAHVQKTAACNGWQFWFAEIDGREVPLDFFRQQLRAGLQ
jgi:modification methylase